jgi:hypothetical protein
MLECAWPYWKLFSTCSFVYISLPEEYLQVSSQEGGTFLIHMRLGSIYRIYIKSHTPIPSRLFPPLYIHSAPVPSLTFPSSASQSPL